jgi:hypothetical protein
MLSIASVLTAYKDHLPTNWKPSDGLRLLFPAHYSGSISPLRSYVTFFYTQLATQGYGEDAQGQTYTGPECIGNLWLGVDGEGRWFFGWIYGKSPVSNTAPRQAGFIFKYSPDGAGRGYIDTSRPPLFTLSCNAGQDDTIKQNWPAILTGGSRILFQGPLDLAPSNLWLKGGWFQEMDYVSGSSTVPAAGSPSGSSLFPFPAAVSATKALDPPEAILEEGQQQNGGGNGGGSSNTFDPPSDPDTNIDIPGSTVF